MYGSNEASLTEKIETIAEKIYDADGVEYDTQAVKQLKRLTELGFGSFPVCMAKLSSHSQMTQSF